MKKAKTTIDDKTQLDEDMDIFEEWEEDLEAPKKKKKKDMPAKEELKEELTEPENEPEELVHEPVYESAHEENLADELANLAPDVPVNLVAVIGKTTMSVADLIKYRVGQVIDLGRVPGETVDVVANGRLIARGELVEMDGKMGVKIVKMVR